MARFTPDSPDYLLTPEETAKIFGVSVVTIARWSNQGLLPCVRTLGNRRRYRQADVKALKGE